MAMKSAAGKALAVGMISITAVLGAAGVSAAETEIKKEDVTGYAYSQQNDPDDAVVRAMNDAYVHCLDQGGDTLRHYDVKVTVGAYSTAYADVKAECWKLKGN